MTQKELIDQIFVRLDRVRKELFDTVAFLPSTAFEQRFDKKWNALDILGHLYKFESLLFMFFEHQIPTKTSRPLMDFNPKHLSQGWHDALNNDNEKYVTPDIMKAERISKDDYTKIMENMRIRLKNAVYGHIDKDFSRVVIPHPNSAQLNLIQWLELMEIHEKRHIRQLANLAF